MVYRPLNGEILMEQLGSPHAWAVMGYCSSLPGSPASLTRLLSSEKLISRMSEILKRLSCLYKRHRIRGQFSKKLSFWTTSALSWGWKAFCSTWFSCNTHFNWLLEEFLRWCCFYKSRLSQLSALSSSRMLLLPSCCSEDSCLHFSLRLFACCCSRHKVASFHGIREWFGKHVALKPRFCLASQTHGKTIALLSVQTESSCLSQTAQTVPAHDMLDTRGCWGCLAWICLPLQFPCLHFMTVFIQYGT